MTQAEREQLIRHEEWISRPVKEIFPRHNDDTRRRILCRGCGEEFTQHRLAGKLRVWCSTKCRDQVWNASKREQRAAKPPRLPRGPEEGGPSLL